MTSRIFGHIPERLRGTEFVHPWVYPWFLLATFAIGIPGTLARPAGSWVAVACGVAICLAGATTLWLLLRNTPRRTLATWITVIGQIILIVGASFVAQALNPVESFAGGNASESPTLGGGVFTFLSMSMAIVWGLTWTLVAILVAFQRGYRASRRLLTATFARLASAAEQFTKDVLDPIRSLEIDIASRLRVAIDLLEPLSHGASRKNRETARAEIESLWEANLAPALKRLGEISLNEDVPVAVSRRRRGRFARVAPRWNGRYFSGIVGALIIGIVAIASGTSVTVTSPGFFVQIPLIMIAFFVSVPSALLLFIAAALTPFLGPNSNAPENFGFFIVILVLAFISFLQRANEVRQLRNLESLSVANGSLALEFVSFRQRANGLKQRMTSVIHSKIQSILVVAQEHLSSREAARDVDLSRIVFSLRDAADELSASLPEPETNFASAIADVLALWDGSMQVSLSVDPEAEEILRADPHAAATAIEVISEGTLNAAKYASIPRVTARVSAEGRRLRIAVTNDRAVNHGAPHVPMSLGLGLEYLRKLTSELRLDSNETSTTLFAEVPSRVNLGELSGR